MTFTITVRKLHLAIAVIAVALLAPATAALADHIFVDVSDQKFYADPINWALDNDITTGSPAGADTFKPEDPVTRGESVTFLNRYDTNIVQPAIDGLDADVAANTTALETKADASSVYTQTEVDSALATKSDVLEVYTGQLTQRYPANTGFSLAGGSYPRPLPSGVATPTLEYLASGTSANCPGIGQAATAGILCVYAYNNLNIGTVALSGESGGDNKRYGFSLDIFPATSSLNGFFLASWAYRVPSLGALGALGAAAETADDSGDAAPADGAPVGSRGSG